MLKAVAPPSDSDNPLTPCACVTEVAGVPVAAGRLFHAGGSGCIETCRHHLQPEKATHAHLEMNFAVLEATSCEPDRINEFIKRLVMPLILCSFKKCPSPNLSQTKALRYNSQNMGNILPSHRFILPGLI
jgi:hypothetical protein